MLDGPRGATVSFLCVGAFPGERASICFERGAAPRRNGDMASIKDVARLAGVSIATVSRAINNLDVVSEATRNRIIRAVEHLDYNPNLAARSLKLNRSKLLGLLVPDIENPFYATLARHVEAATAEAGYSLILCNTDYNQDTEEKYLRLLAGRLADGVFLCRSSGSGSPAPDPAGRSLPCVVVDRHAENEPMAAVMTDNSRIGELAAGHLLALGHRKCGCIAESPELPTFTERIRGFSAALAAGGGNLLPGEAIAAGHRISDGYEAMRKILDLHAAERPTAIYCTNDTLAFGAVHAIFEAGLRVPVDMSVIGTDDVPQSSHFIPKLTTIAQPFREIAVRAFEALRHISKARDAVGVTLLEPHLVKRDSTGPAGRARSGADRSRRSRSTGSPG